MNDDLILEALQAATLAAVTASAYSSLPVKYLGRTMVVPNDMRYLETVFIPNNITGEFLAGGKTYRGLYRLLLHWGLDDAGAVPPMQAIKAISAYFYKGRTFQNGSVSVTLTDEPDVTGVIENPPELIVPVTIRYLSFQKPT